MNTLRTARAVFAAATLLSVATALPGVTWLWPAQGADRLPSDSLLSVWADRLPSDTLLSVWAAPAADSRVPGSLTHSRMPAAPVTSTGTPVAPAYFEVGFTSLPTVTFVIKVVSPETIAEARAVLDAGERRSVMGLIVKEPADYNPPWSYHIDPATVSLFEFAIEVCDASPLYVEEHLDEACGAFLPDCRWCPWSSFLSREIPPPGLVTPTSTATGADPVTATATDSLSPTATPTGLIQATATPTPTGQGSATPTPSPLATDGPTPATPTPTTGASPPSTTEPPASIIYLPLVYNR
jgi:hypothetical protein